MIDLRLVYILICIQTNKKNTSRALRSERDQERRQTNCAQIEKENIDSNCLELGVSLKVVYCTLELYCVSTLDILRAIKLVTDSDQNDKVKYVYCYIRDMFV